MASSSTFLSFRGHHVCWIGIWTEIKGYQILVLRISTIRPNDIIYYVAVLVSPDLVFIIDTYIEFKVVRTIIKNFLIYLD